MERGNATVGGMARAMRAPAWAWVCTLAGLSLGLVACGGGADPETGTGPSTGTGTGGSTVPEIVAPVMPPSAPPVTPPPVVASVLSGRVASADQPLAGAVVQVYAAPLGVDAVARQIGQAVTQADGSFRLERFASTPIAGELIYLLARVPSQEAVVLMSVAGVWGAGSWVADVRVNELTTVASASQLNRWLMPRACAEVPGSTVTSGSCPVLLGQPSWARADSAIAALADVATGSPGAWALSSNGSAALANMNLQASVLAQCVRASAASAACSGLLSASTGTLPAGSLRVRGSATPTVASLNGEPLDLALSPSGRYVYAPNIQTASVAAFRINPSGTLTLLGTPAATGLGPSAVAITPDERFAYVTNYGDGTVSMFSVSATGTLVSLGAAVSTGAGADSIPQGITVAPSGQYAYVANSAKGTVSAFKIEASGALTLIGQPVATGTSRVSEPVAITLTPDGKYAYVLNYMQSSISMFQVNLDGSLTGIGTPVHTGSPAGSGYPVSLAVSPNGRHAYAVNGSGNTVAAFTVGTQGSLTPKVPFLTPVGLTAQGYPTDISLTADGRLAYVSVEGEGTVAAFRIDAAGQLTTLGRPTLSGSGAGSAPKSVLVSRHGRHVYVANANDSRVSTFGIEPETATDVLAALLNLHNAFPAAAASTAVHGLLTAAPLYGPVPAAAPTSLVLTAP